MAVRILALTCERQSGLAWERTVSARRPSLAILAQAIGQLMKQVRCETRFAHTTFSSGPFCI